MQFQLKNMRCHCGMSPWHLAIPLICQRQLQMPSIAVWMSLSSISTQHPAHNNMQQWINELSHWRLLLKVWQKRQFARLPGCIVCQMSAGVALTTRYTTTSDSIVFPNAQTKRMIQQFVSKARRSLRSSWRSKTRAGKSMAVHSPANAIGVQAIESSGIKAQKWYPSTEAAHLQKWNWQWFKEGMLPSFGPESGGIDDGWSSHSSTTDIREEVSTWQATSCSQPTAVFWDLSDSTTYSSSNWAAWKWSLALGYGWFRSWFETWEASVSRKHLQSTPR